MPECPLCKHKHNFWDVSIMARTHKHAEAFIEITAHKRSSHFDGFEFLEEINILSCPKCSNLFYSESD